MGTPPRDSKKVNIKSPVAAKASASASASKLKSTSASASAPAPAPAPAPALALASDPAPKGDDTSPTKSEASKSKGPLAPPPRKASQAAQSTPDYFSSAHGNLQNESNPFERSFAGGASDANGGGVQTPGGTKLPSVAALTSPSGLLGSGITSNFWGGLRSGPLSPAMLSGPQKEDYFSEGHHGMSRGFTPNESSLRSGLTPGGDNSFLRTGLTPGGGGSMFPEPSPTSIYASLQGGGATPGTVEFRNTALNAMKVVPRSEAARSSITSQPQPTSNGIETKPTVAEQLDSHDNDAANGLFLLSHARPQAGQNHFITPAVHGHPQPSVSGAQSNGTSPTTGPQHGHNGSISTTSGRAVSEGSPGYSDENEQVKGPTTRNKSRKSVAQSSQTNGRRKAEDTPTKGPAKKAKGNTGKALAPIEPEPQSEDEPDMTKDQYHANGKKMTDEEKRKNFLERNRVAALKCRQRKKQWLANLQQKVEIFSSENDNLTAQINHLREELVNLKTLLLAHKDCPVSQQQGISGIHMQAVMEGGYSSQMNPYGMAAALNSQPVMAGQAMQESRNYP